MKGMLSRAIREYWPILLLICIELLLFGATYTPKTWLLGWDNMVPEFGIKTNLWRSLSGVWQSYRGLGLYDGMSHIAELPHVLLVALLKFILPISLIRYCVIFLTHFAGGIGMYSLLCLLFSLSQKKKLFALAGTLLYLFNLTTIQIFYAPLEAFTYHFASLPWIALSLYAYLHVGDKTTLLRYVLVLLVTLPQFFVPTLFLPISILIASFCLFSLFAPVSPPKKLGRILTIFITTLLVYSHWLLPYIAGIPQNAEVIKNAKINIMSSGDVFARNQAFGSVWSVLSNQGYMLDFEDILPDGTYTFFMSYWRTVTKNPIFISLSWLSSILMLSGLIVAVKKRQYHLWSIVLTGILSFLFLANNTPVIQSLMNTIRTSLPILGEAYRSPYTKFGMLFSFSSTIFLTYTLLLLSTFLKKHRIIARILPTTIGVILILPLITPSLSGHFISDRMKPVFPPEYQQFFHVMSSENPHGRIVYLPAHSYWSWKYYDFDYRGSGFLWFGLSQPLLDRAFDPWSSTNEGLYWELSNALYKKDETIFERVLQKYDASYILLDEHLVSASNSRELLIPEIKEMIAKLPHFSPFFRDGKLTAYKNSTEINRLSLSSPLPTTYRSTQNVLEDAIFTTIGSYQNAQTQTRPDVFFPFETLFTHRLTEENPVAIDKTVHRIRFSSAIPFPLAGLTLASPSGNLKDMLSLDDSQIIYESSAGAMVFDTSSDPYLSKGIFSSCALLKSGDTHIERKNSDGMQFLQFSSANQRGCMTLNLPNVSHARGYLIFLSYRPITGRPFLFSVINETTKHTEQEHVLTGAYGAWKTSTFVLPPRAPDGIGYTLYIANESLSDTLPTVNDLGRITLYEIPYDELVTIRLANDSYNTNKKHEETPLSYEVADSLVRTASTQPFTVVLSESFQSGWTAWKIHCDSKLSCGIKKRLPFLFGRQVTQHILVNGWKNGWIVEPDCMTTQYLTQSCNTTVAVVFLPQWLQYMGYALLGILLTVIGSLFLSYRLQTPRS